MGSIHAARAVTHRNGMISENTRFSFHCYSDPGTGDDWHLVSDHPRWPDAPWPSDAAIIGEVKWMAREL